MDTLLWFGLGLGAGAGGVAAAWLAYRGALRRRNAAEASTAPSVEWPAPGRPTPPPTDPVAAESVNVTLDAPPAAGVADLVRLSEKVVLQLARQGRMDPDTPVRRERTQQGLAEAASSNQSAVSKVLRRLVAAGIISEERRHIVGASQRMKAYGLTRRGELLAREVARRRHVDLLPVRESSPPARGSQTPATSSR